MTRTLEDSVAVLYGPGDRAELVFFTVSAWGWLTLATGTPADLEQLRRDIVAGRLSINPGF